MNNKLQITEDLTQNYKSNYSSAYSVSLILQVIFMRKKHNHRITPYYDGAQILDISIIQRTIDILGV